MVKDNQTCRCQIDNSIRDRLGMKGNEDCFGIATNNQAFLVRPITI